MKEFDIDAVLKRNPEFVLVDELAHTNAEGSRHNKRYHDVLELLDHGINVYTTLNVQHVESQADVVEQITGVKIREKLSDSILDRADSIELIDISPEGLLKRLSEGKVYIPEKAELAAERFFRKGNITALRQMALNYVAKSVDSDLQDYMQRNNIQGPWKAGDRPHGGGQSESVFGVPYPLDTENGIQSESSMGCALYRKAAGVVRIRKAHVAQQSQSCAGAWR